MDTADGLNRKNTVSSHYYFSFLNKTSYYYKLAREAWSLT